MIIWRLEFFWKETFVVKIQFQFLFLFVSQIWILHWFNFFQIRGKDLAGAIKVMPMGMDAAIKKRVSGEFKSEVSWEISCCKNCFLHDSYHPVSHILHEPKSQCFTCWKLKSVKRLSKTNSLLPATRRHCKLFKCWAELFDEARDEAATVDKLRRGEVWGGSQRGNPLPAGGIPGRSPAGEEQLVQLEPAGELIQQQQQLHGEQPAELLQQPAANVLLNLCPKVTAADDQLAIVIQVFLIDAIVKHGAEGEK